MRFALTPEQESSRRTLRELLARACTPAQVRAAFSGSERGKSALWDQLAEFGLLGLLADPELGGSGLGPIELAALLEECGRAAVPDPVLETSAVTVPLLSAWQSDPRIAAWLERLTTGRGLVLSALDATPYVNGAHLADALLVQVGDEAHLALRSEVELLPQESVDGARRLFRVSFSPREDSRVARGPAVSRAFAEAFDRGALAAAAELLGLGVRMIEMAIEHAKTRRQFGQPIGTFQAVKHHLVDAHIGIAFARPLVYRAAHSLAHADPERRWHVSAAKAAASEAAWRAARKALQVHGAIGYSFEHDLHLWMKRVWALAAEWGDAAWHRTRVANAILGESV
ncbi:MAG TPA: acyl-CoA dehydrogenase family protein [Polyangiaceae bacterium]|nr:acyl-CoA dehydrogenase family protein [Polyangiaceae bacterium]